MSDNSPSWFVADITPIRDLARQEFFETSDGNMKKVGGDIHSTVDVNPNSPTFGEVHSTLQLPKKK